MQGFLSLLRGTSPPLPFGLCAGLALKGGFPYVALLGVMARSRESRGVAPR